MDTPHRYLVALGSNMRHRRHGAPRAVLAAALAHLAQEGLTVEATAPVIVTAPLGPSRRRYANSVAVLRSRLDPPALLERLHAVEARFGRRRGGQPWGQRVLDLDIVLWDGGAWASPGLVVPHIAFRTRGFVLGPALAVAAGWRDPLTGARLRHIYARLRRCRPHPA